MAIDRYAGKIEYQERPFDVASATVGRPDTELESVLTQASEVALLLERTAREIATRVLSPEPNPSKGDAPTAIPVTYADKVRALHGRLEKVQSVLGEMNGRI